MMRRDYIAPLVFVLVFSLSAGCTMAVSSQSASVKEEPARLDSAIMQFKMGAAYYCGLGVRQDYRMAAYWYQKSAVQGYAEAQNSLGSLYQEGLGVSKNYYEAVRWYKLAADQNHPQGINNWGYMYDLGLGVTQNRKKAAALYRSSAELGFAHAMLNLGVCYFQGLVNDVDYVQAYQWIDLAQHYNEGDADKKLKWQARALIHKLEAGMTRDQIEQGKKLSARWMDQRLCLSSWAGPQ